MSCIVHRGDLVIFIPHFIFTGIICVVGSIAILKILAIAIKRDLATEKYLFGCLYLLYSFSYYDFLVMVMSRVDEVVPGIHLAFEGLTQMIYFQFCILFAGIAIFICLLAMMWMLKMVRVPKNIKPWQFILINVLLLGTYIQILLSSSVYNMDGYTVIVSDSWIIGSVLIVSAFSIMFLIINLKFFPFLKKQTKYLKISSRKNLFYGILINLIVEFYATGLYIRIYFGTSWDTILVADFLFLISTTSALVVGFFPGIGESLLCLRNMESVFIFHQSGKLIYSRKLFPGATFDEEFFGAFLLIINEITKEIRTTGGRISQIVLEDNSEIVMWKGEFIQGVLITKTYNPLFINKLQDLVVKIEKKMGVALKYWTGKHLELDQQIESMIKDLF